MQTAADSVALLRPSRNPSTRSASAAPSPRIDFILWGARSIPLRAAPGLPVRYCCDDRAIYVAPGINAAELAKALWFYLRTVGGFRGEDGAMEAAILPIAQRRAKRLQEKSTAGASV